MQKIQIDYKYANIPKFCNNVQQDAITNYIVSEIGIKILEFIDSEELPISDSKDVAHKQFKFFVINAETGSKLLKYLTKLKSQESDIAQVISEDILQILT